MEKEEIINEYHKLVDDIKKDINGVDIWKGSKTDDNLVYSFLCRKIERIRSYSDKFRQLGERFNEIIDEDEEEIFSLSSKIKVLEKYNRADILDKNALEFAKMKKEMYSQIQETSVYMAESLKAVASELEEKLNNNEVKKGLEIIEKISREYNENC